MPYEVRGEDGRLLHRQLTDGDARDMAARVVADTGETVVLTPWREVDGDYVLAPKDAEKVGPPVEEKKSKKAS